MTLGVLLVVANSYETKSDGHLDLSWPACPFRRTVTNHLVHAEIKIWLNAAAQSIVREMEKMGKEKKPSQPKLAPPPFFLPPVTFGLA